MSPGAAESLPRTISGEPDFFVQRALLAAIVDSSDDAIVSKTLEGQILSWNAGAARIFGYSAQEAIGKSITLIVPPELWDEERDILAKLARGERIDHFDTVRLTKDGRRIPISVTVSPIRDATGRIIGASKVARDISERKRTEEVQLESEQALREADRRKDEFLALLAHELRNPLAPIRYALAIAENAGCPEPQRRQAEAVIARQVAHMGRLLDDLLDSSRITRGTLELKLAHTELTRVVGAAIETSRPSMLAKRHQLTLDLPTHSVMLNADPVRLAQVFSNLLINASKYTEAGGQITLSAKQQNDDIVISVRDNGIGIAAETLPQLFNLFSQAPGARAHSEGGLGIGLALARGLTQLHGGTIDAHSAGLGRGSEFVVRLPVAARETPRAAEEREPQPSTRVNRMKILVVDDNRDGADSLATMLELSGHEVHTAYTGHTALERAQTLRPDVLLTDIGLPDLDGYELGRHVRTTQWGRDMLLIAVTGWGQQSDRERAYAAGFDHHLTKPIAPEQLDSLLESPRGGAACGAEKAPPAASVVT
jgi:two-component system, chemotaxis family, CheB/CheR fusion protein